jgi:hypothetical protein
MTRPLERLGIDALESLAEPQGVSPKDLKSIAGELAHRSTLRASLLLDKVNLKLKSLGNAAPAATRDLAGTPTPTQNGFDFDVPVFVPTKPPTRPSNPMPVAAATLPLPVVLPTYSAASSSVQEQEQVPLTMPIARAYQVLSATSASSWDVIELSRRQLVARAQPDRVESMEPAKRKALLDEAREANIAYKVLFQARS